MTTDTATCPSCNGTRFVYVSDEEYAEDDSSPVKPCEACGMSGQAPRPGGPVPVVLHVGECPGHGDGCIEVVLVDREGDVTDFIAEPCGVSVCWDPSAPSLREGGFTVVSLSAVVALLAVFAWGGWMAWEMLNAPMRTVAP